METKKEVGLQGKYVYHLTTDYNFLSDVDMYTIFEPYYISFEVKHWNTMWTSGNLGHQEKLIERMNGPAMIVMCEIPMGTEVSYVDGCITGLRNNESTKNAIIKLDSTEIVDIEFNNFFTKEEIEKIRKKYLRLPTGYLLRELKAYNFI